MNDPLMKAEVEISATIDNLVSVTEQAKSEIRSVGQVSDETGRKIQSFYENLSFYFTTLTTNGNKAVAAQNEVAAATSKVSDATKKVAETSASTTAAAIGGFRKMSRAITGTIGSVAALIGVLALLIRSQDRLNKLFGEGAQRAQEFSGAIGFATDIEGAEKRAKAIEDQTLKLEQNLSFWIRLREELGVLGEGSGIIASRIRSLTEEIDSLRQSSQSVREQIAILRPKDAENIAKAEADARAAVLMESARKLSDQERDIRERTYLESLDEEKRITAEAMLEIARLRREAYIEGTGVDLSGIIDAINAEKDARIKAYREQKAEEERIDKEKNARVAKDAADKMEREMTRAFEAAAASLDQRLGTLAGFGGFQSIADAIRDLANAQDRYPGGRR